MEDPPKVNTYIKLEVYYGLLERLQLQIYNGRKVSYISSQFREVRFEIIKSSLQICKFKIINLNFAHIRINERDSIHTHTHVKNTHYVE